jgi:hypothetical protein
LALIQYSIRADKRYNLNNAQAITTVRRSRPLSIQTAKQQKFIHRFKDHLLRKQAVYPMIISTTSFNSEEAKLYLEPSNLSTILSNQRTYLRGIEHRLYRNVPKVRERHLFVC